MGRPFGCSKFHNSKMLAMLGLNSNYLRARILQSLVKIEEIVKVFTVPPQIYDCNSLFPMLHSTIKYKQTIHEEAERRGREVVCAKVLGH